jgi:hypothetical protein
MTTITDPGCREQNQAWMFYEVTYVRRDAQAEADLADHRDALPFGRWQR